MKRIIKYFLTATLTVAVTVFRQTKNFIFAAFTPHLRFSADTCGGKTPCKRKIALKAIFQGHRGGIGGDRVQSKIFDFCERHSRPRACRHALTATLTIAVILLSVGCGAPNVKKGGKLNVLCTVFPLYDWARNIAGNTAEVSLLNENGADMHSYQPTAADIVKLNTCDVLIYTGGESEEWVTEVTKSFKNKESRVLNLIELLGERAVPEREEGTESRRNEEETDEHIWLSLKNAEILTDKITAALAAADSENADIYVANAAEYSEKLKALDENYTETLKNAKHKTLIFADRFPFRYLADDYGLNCYAAFPGCSAETEASFETIAFLAKKADENGDCIFVTETSDLGIAKTVNNSTAKKNKKIIILDSMQSVKKKDIKSGVTYISVMEKNLEKLKEGLLK